MLIGERIRQLRDQRGWSQGQLVIQARRFSPEIRLARETISRLENGRHAPDMWVNEALAKAFGIGLSELFAGVDTGGVDGGSDEAVGRDALPADIREIVERLELLPEGARSQVTTLVGQMLDLIEDGLYAGLSAQGKQLVDYFDGLTDADQEVALEAVQEILRQRAAGPESRAGQQAIGA